MVYWRVISCDFILRNPAEGYKHGCVTNCNKKPFFEYNNVSSCWYFVSCQKCKCTRLFILFRIKVYRRQEYFRKEYTLGSHCAPIYLWKAKWYKRGHSYQWATIYHHQPGHRLQPQPVCRRHIRRHQRHPMGGRQHRPRPAMGFKIYKRCTIHLPQSFGRRSAWPLHHPW